ncbi:sensor histidine kinase [Chamaesiphon minutus]|uniref:histidine kinase n=1 Tax=Chamaesiphon minutus (strain ATCC 27169 / PCC 6605) TaxID=1173020 RepID=K9UJW5_CHAP6|nr:HAMP domain-containing sensor histidine kinase [Chamaesiphon minutus]AFY94948.1 signal transduction histidine kinase [Chamaesiphon minutus PCC 6605]
MLSHTDSTYLCQLTAAQIQEILVLNGVSIQQYQPQLHQWLTIAQLPDLGQLTLRLEPEKAAEIDRRLHDREIVEFTAMTTVMNINICDRYVFIPLLVQARCTEDIYSQQLPPTSELWGRICLLGNLNSIWTAQDLSWVQALGQQLLTAINMLVEVSMTTSSIPITSSPLADLAELIEKISTLESRCQQKDDFINNIAHDLRAPLMNIKMAMRMLKTSLNNDPIVAEILVGHSAEKYLAILEQECDREVDLIDKTLELQRLELSSDKVELEVVDIATWLPTTIEPFIHRAHKHRQKLTVAPAQWLPTIMTNRSCLTKIAIELLNNACKYTDLDGQILVEIEANPQADWMAIVFKNQAEISAQHLPHIFEQFYRIPGSDRSQQGGSGLGLSLVQKLVAQLHGEIQLASTGGWTEFAVKLPVELRS